jgi:CheY-like chemotaxis protein
MAVGRPAVQVLVVDDSEEFLLGVCGWVTAQPGLRLAGTARSGDEALTAVERLHPDLVLMDVAMPGMDGLEATRRIKSRADAPLVVILTFHATQVARQEAWAAGADGFVAKADVSEELHRVIGELLTDRHGTPSVHVNPEAPVRLDSQGD